MEAEHQGDFLYGSSITFSLHYSNTARVFSVRQPEQSWLSGQKLEEGAPLELKAWVEKILEGIV